MARVWQFKRHQRLLKATEFKNVFSQPHKLTNYYFTVLVKPNELPYARLGLVIAKKHVKRAVNRNRVKRLIRESFRLHQQLLCGWDCVVLARDKTEQANNRTLSDSLAKQWQRLE